MKTAMLVVAKLGSIDRIHGDLKEVYMSEPFISLLSPSYG